MNLCRRHSRTLMAQIVKKGERASSQILTINVSEKSRQKFMLRLLVTAVCQRLVAWRTGGRC